MWNIHDVFSNSSEFVIYALGIRRITHMIHTHWNEKVVQGVCVQQDYRCSNSDNLGTMTAYGSLGDYLDSNGDYINSSG